ncbi:MAG TPA: PAS domain S-box protein [Terriglobia bacterium]|nr:PAS domain S-box protein [Terriglobia bacterium]
MTSPSLVMVGHHEYYLVALSVLVSMLAAYATLELAGRVIGASARARLPWLIGGAAASAIGTWSMHFTAMRAFTLPVQVWYDWPTALLSLLPAIFASSVAILVVSRRELKSLRTIAGGILIGGGIAVLHYTAMASMRLPAMCHYSPALVTLSVLLAILVSVAPLRLMFLSLDEPAAWGWRKAASISLLGMANPVMHYTGMAAATFTRSPVVPNLSHAMSISTIGLQVFTIIPLMVLTIALVASLVDQLRKNEDRLRQIIDTIPTMAWSVRPDGVVDFLNQRWVDYSGLSLEQYVQEPTRPIHPDDIPRIMEKWQAGMAAGEPYEQEMRLRRADGEYRWFLVRTAPLRDQQGTIFKWYGVSIDIEDRKQANEELRQAEDRIRAILDFSPNWIFLKDTEGRYLLVNKEVERVFRVSQDQIKGKTDSEIFLSEHAAEYRANDLKVLREGVSMEFEEVADLKDGPHTSIVHKFPLFDTHGNIYATGGVATDITERKRAEEALRKSEERWRSVFENSAIGVALTDLNGQFLATNPVYQKMVGYTEEELQGQTFLDITHEDYREANWTLIDELLEEKRLQFQIEKQYRRKDGSSIWVRKTVSLVPGSESVPRFIMVLSEDITERKRAEKALRKSREHLRLVIDTVPALIYTALPDGGLDFLNQRWLNYVGLSLEDLSGWKWMTVIHPEDVAALVEKWRAVLATGEPFEHEARVRRADGEYRRMFLRKVPLHDERGTVVKWYGSGVDIEDRKRAEDDLRGQKEILQKIFDNVPAMIGFVGQDGKIKLANRDWERTLGWTLEEVLGQDLDVFAELYPDPKYRQEVMEFVFRSNAQFADFRTRVRDGRMIDTSWANVHLADGTTIGIGRDITERKRAEQALRNSEEQYRTVIQAATDAVISFDENGKILLANAATTGVFGYTPSELIGNPLTILMPEFLRKLHEAGFQRYLKTGDRHLNWQGTELIGLRKTGEQFPVEVSFGEFIEDERHIFTGFIRDITERKRAEEELQQSRDQLRALAARLQNVREEERTRVAREIHDELGQALTAIKIDLSSLIHDMPAEKKEKSESTLKLVDDTIQSVRRISTELRPGILDDMGLGAAVEWAAEEFEVRTGTKCRVSLPKAKIALDPERATAVFRIFQETLTNVARHANATEVEVQLALENGNLILEVHDNGKGVNSEQFPAGKSLGILGMRERALLLGGELEISSAPGKGTTVRVGVPEGKHKKPE